MPQNGVKKKQNSSKVGNKLPKIEMGVNVRNCGKRPKITNSWPRKALNGQTWAKNGEKHPKMAKIDHKWPW